MGKSCSCLNNVPKEHKSNYTRNLLHSPSNTTSTTQNDHENEHKVTSDQRKTRNTIPKLTMDMKQDKDKDKDKETEPFDISLPDIYTACPTQSPSQSMITPIPASLPAPIPTFNPIAAHNHTQFLDGRPRLSKPISDTDNSGKLITINTRLQYTTGGISSVTGIDEAYRRLNTNSASFVGFNIDESDLICDYPEDDDGLFVPTDSELELHRIITIGYITRETEAYDSINIPLCVIEMCRKYYFALKPIRRKRVIFTSIVQLNLCIDKIPSYVLEESIFFFKVNGDKKEVLSFLGKYHETIEDILEDSLGSNSKSGEGLQADNKGKEVMNSLDYIKDLQPHFIEYLKQKMHDNLLLLMDDNSSWKDINKQLMNIEDIWYDQDAHTKNCYSSLILNGDYWMKMDVLQTKYNIDSPENILEEIDHGTLKYLPSMEILWQSNPSLIPMKIFDLKQYHLQNGYNKEYILKNSKCASRQSIRGDTMREQLKKLSLEDHINDDDEKIASLPSIDNDSSLPQSYLKTNQWSGTTVTGNTDLVILSMYNSNDYSEISPTSQCYNYDGANVTDIDFNVMMNNNLFMDITSNNSVNSIKFNYSNTHSMPPLPINENGEDDTH